MFRPEPLDILIVALVAMLLFGANRLPESARSIGKAIREFRAAITGQETSDVSREGAVSVQSSEPAVASTQDDTMVPCKNCGKSIKARSKFCPHCGTAL